MYDITQLFPGQTHTSWREHQEETVGALVDWLNDFGAGAGKRFCLLHAPTGAGKSVIGLGAAQATNRTGVVLTSTIQLQHQYSQTFAEGFMGVLEGRRNFPCYKSEIDPKRKGLVLTAEENSVECRGCDYKETDCQYYRTRRDELAKPSLIFNYAKWQFEIHLRADLQASTFEGRFKGLLICDEADVLLDQATSAATFEATENYLSRMFGQGGAIPDERSIWHKETKYPAYPHGSGVASEWWDWLQEVMPIMAQELTDTEMALRGRDLLGDPPPEAADWKKRMVALKYCLQSMETVTGESQPICYWKFTDPAGVTISPIQPKNSFQRNIADEAFDKVLLMTATPPTPQFFSTFLGMGKDDIHVVTIPSAFPADRAPIETVHEPVLTTYKARTADDGLWQEWVDEIDELLYLIWQPTPGVLNDQTNVLLYVRSNVNKRKFLELSRFAGQGRFMDYDERNRLEILNEFSDREKTTGTCLVGTGIERGMDLYGDKCRAIIVAKLPVSYNPSDKLTQARSEVYGNYTAELDAGDFAQLVGRAMRAADDMCATFIVDHNPAWWKRGGKGSPPAAFLPQEVSDRLKAGGPYAALLDRKAQLHMGYSVADMEPGGWIKAECGKCGNVHFGKVGEENLCAICRNGEQKPVTCAKCGDSFYNLDGETICFLCV